jgi:hypothetical protein
MQTLGGGQPRPLPAINNQSPPGMTLNNPNTYANPGAPHPIIQMLQQALQRQNPNGGTNGVMSAPLNSAGANIFMNPLSNPLARLQR